MFLWERVLMGYTLLQIWKCISAVVYHVHFQKAAHLFCMRIGYNHC